MDSWSKKEALLPKIHLKEQTWITAPSKAKDLKGNFRTRSEERPKPELYEYSW